MKLISRHSICEEGTLVMRPFASMGCVALAQLACSQDGRYIACTEADRLLITLLRTEDCTPVHQAEHAGWSALWFQFACGRHQLYVNSHRRLYRWSPDA